MLLRGDLGKDELISLAREVAWLWGHVASIQAPMWVEERITRKIRELKAQADYLEMGATATSDTMKH